jgi:hypothetical protein
LDDVLKFPGRARPLSEEQALARLREVGTVEGVNAFAEMVGWERTRASRTVEQWRTDGKVVCRSRPGRKTLIEAVVAALPVVQEPAQPPMQEAGAIDPPVLHDYARVARVELPRLERLATGTGVLEGAFSHGVAAWCRVVFGIVMGASSFALFCASVFLNAAFWPGLAPTEDAKAILAVFGFVVETSNYMIPSALTLVQMSSSLRRRLSVLLVLTMATAAIAGASFVRSNLGSAEVSRDQTIKERNRLQGIVSAPLKPVSDAAVVDARSRVETVKSDRKTNCPKNKNLDIEVCNKWKAALEQAEADLKKVNETHDADAKLAEQQHRKDVADAQAGLKALPETSNDKNVVLAGVAAIVPWASEAAVNGIVASLWVALLLIGPCLLLRLGMALLLPTRN